MGTKVIGGPSPVIVKQGLSVRTGLRFLGAGTVLGGAVGFTSGFLLAQAIYSDEEERKQVKKNVKVGLCACGGAALLGIIGTVLASRS